MIDPAREPTYARSEPGAEPAAEPALEISRLREALRASELELHALRDQLRSIQNSDAWAILRTVNQLGEVLAPRGTWRNDMARSALKGLRRFKKTTVRISRGTREAAARLAGPHRRIESAAADSSVSGAYTILCLPVIEWSFRFQRPQQLMRQFARRGYQVFYAANHFRGSASAKVRALEPRIHELILPGDPTANVYQGLPSGHDTDRMHRAIAALRSGRELEKVLVVAQLPYWTDLAERLRREFGWPVVYDCMDDHAGFWHNTPDVLDAEHRLLTSADLVIASSERLAQKVRARARTTLLVRNACEYDHFHLPDLPPRAGPPVVGYYGAISDWFDTALVRGLASARPGWSFELIGSTLGGDVRPLEELPNVRLLGERPYAALPELIRHWDCFVIPFKRIPLTEATNPVKVYEMLATGRPVVAVPLPELAPIARQGLIALADGATGFATALDTVLAEVDSGVRQRRRDFARANTWEARQRELAAAFSELLADGESGFEPREPGAAVSTARRDGTGGYE